MIIYEIIGYSGSFLIAISLLMNNIFKLRIINCIGAILFSTYGLLIKAPAVFLLNAFIAVINIYYIFVLKTKKDVFKFIKSEPQNKILEFFINYNLNDIKNFFPNFDTKILNQDVKCFLIMRNLVLVGIFIFKKENEKAEILVDYVTKEYRDFKNATAFFNSEEIKQEFKNLHIKQLFIFSENEKYNKYLKKIGFQKSLNNNKIFYKNL
ncbi:MAG: hypothetical protein ACK4WJ_06225 [Endomicrobiia bacterium]